MARPVTSARMSSLPTPKRYYAEGKTLLLLISQNLTTQPHPFYRKLGNEVFDGFYLQGI